MGYPCVVAMNCGNLLAVAQALKEKYSKQIIIFLADNDQTIQDLNMPAKLSLPCTLL